MGTLSYLNDPRLHSPAPRQMEYTLNQLSPDAMVILQSKIHLPEFYITEFHIADPEFSSDASRLINPYSVTIKFYVVQGSLDLVNTLVSQAIEMSDTLSTK